jgi:hypothetical protein
MVFRSFLFMLISATCLGFAGCTKRAANQAASTPSGDATCVRRTDLRLIVAALRDDVNAMETELKYGADVNATVEGLGPSLWIATLNGNDRGVELLLDNGANVNQSEADGSTPLITASMIDNRQIAKLLQRVWLGEGWM